MALNPPLVPNSEVALIDERAVQLGCNIEQLMEQAGSALCAHIHNTNEAAAVLVACGPGNNGGDGYVAARLLANAGHRVAVWPVSQARSLLCQKQSAALPESVEIITDANALNGFDIIIDAILGAGVEGEPRQGVKEALEQLRQLKIPCVAADMPTGLEHGLALDSCTTITFQVNKQSLINENVQVIDIGIPAAAYCDTSSVLFRHFPKHSISGHKGDNGSVFVLAGWQFPGARHYCSQASYLTGCDLVHCYVNDDDSVDHACVRQTPSTCELNTLIARCDVALIGPGMGRMHKSLIEECFAIAKELNKPCVLDADAVHILKFQLRGDDHPPVLITPHRGELKALTSSEAYDEGSIHEFASAQKIILAKGAIDFISDGMQWQHNPNGNPRLAVGGTGDVLAGLCAGLVARGCSLFDAARLAVYWECISADTLWQDMGPSYLPDDILHELPNTLHVELDKLDAWPPIN